MTDRLAAQVSAGFLTDTFFRTIVENLELGVEERGWDEPCMLFEICSDGASAEPDATLDNIRALMQGRTLVGHPFDSLCGYVTPADCLAVVLSFEGYSHPDGTDLQKNTSKPSENPDRVEQRLMIVLTADGRFGQLTRVRNDSEAKWGSGSFDEDSKVELDGRIMWALHAVLELPVVGMEYNLLEEVCQEDTLSALLYPVVDNFFKLKGRVAELYPEMHALVFSDSEQHATTLLLIARSMLSERLADASDVEAMLLVFAKAWDTVMGPSRSVDWFASEQATTMCSVSERSLQIVAGIILDEPCEAALWLGTPVLTMALRARRKRCRAVREIIGEDMEQQAAGGVVVERSERRVELLRAAQAEGSL